MLGAACSLVFASNIDDARQQSADGGVLVPTPDAGAPAADSGQGGGDATTTLDSSSAEPQCGTTPAPRFCDDFNTGPLGASWTRVGVDPGGPPVQELALVGGALRATHRNATSGSYTRLLKLFSIRAATFIRFRAMVKLTQPYAGDHDLLFFKMDPSGDPNDGCATIFTADGNPAAQAKINMQNEANTVNDIRDIPGFGKLTADWTEVVFLWKPGLSLETSIGGEKKAYQYPACPFGGDIELAVGFHYGSGSAEVLYDDVSLDWDGTL